MNPALVLCSHGTADPAGQEVIRRVAAAVRRAAHPFEVHESVVDVEDHRLGGVLADLRRPAVVVPLLLSGGFHLHHDITEAVADHPAAVVARPLGPEPALAALGARRLHDIGATHDDVVVLAGSGSSDPRALQDVDSAAALLRAHWGGTVRVGHLGRFGTPAAEVVAAARQDGARRIVVASYLLAPGYFQNTLLAVGADLVTAPLLSASPDHEVVDLVVRRFERAARTLSWEPPSTFDSAATG
ncbi:sirohydrochlorin chelatase [Aeromicrobium sp. Sec7.5]|uniref:sirohydrochlorin chelatase n=1 Tax=Aeromicrobium sp. Sec7.5 TaxID=3121276 RepID=UPI002FE48767